MTFVSRAHEITKPVLVTDDEVIVRAAGAARRVVTERAFDAAVPDELFAVTIISYCVVGVRFPKVAEVSVGEEGIAAAPFNVYV